MEGQTDAKGGVGRGGKALLEKGGDRVVQLACAIERSQLMVDPITFLTELYVSVDDFCKSALEPDVRPGPAASLSASEVVTLAVFGQWQCFGSEQGFYRYARKHLRREFPTLPVRSQFNRLMRQHLAEIQAFSLYLGERMQARDVAYEAMDCTAVATRNVKRRGEGWLAGMSAIGISNRIGWYEGFKLLLSVTPLGFITGYGFSPANVREQPMAETFLAARAFGHPGLPTVGSPAKGTYVVDKGFDGRPNRQRWRTSYGADVLGLPQTPAVADRWPRAIRRWIVSLRQIVETVNEKLLSTFRLDAERPHDLVGFQARLAAKVALHNFAIWLNRLLARHPLAFADLIDW